MSIVATTKPQQLTLVAEYIFLINSHIAIFLSKCIVHTCHHGFNCYLSCRNRDSVCASKTLFVQKLDVVLNQIICFNLSWLTEFPYTSPVGHEVPYTSIRCESAASVLTTFLTRDRFVGIYTNWLSFKNREFGTSHSLVVVQGRQDQTESLMCYLLLLSESLMCYLLFLSEYIV